MIIYYIAEYSFAAVVGHFMTKLVVDRMWSQLGWDGSDDSKLRPNLWLVRVTGVLERIFYVWALHNYLGILIPLLIGAKLAGKLIGWFKGEGDSGKGVQLESAHLIFLTGNILSAIYAIVGAKLLRGYGSESIMNLIIPLLDEPIPLVIATVLMWYWIGYYYRRRNKGA